MAVLQGSGDVNTRMTWIGLVDLMMVDVGRRAVVGVREMDSAASGLFAVEGAADVEVANLRQQGNRIIS